MRHRHAIVAVLLVTVAARAQAADPWVEVASPNFTVVSNANDRRTRDVAWQFEQIRAALLAGWPWARARLDRPVLVIAAKDENTMKALAPEYWERRGGTRPDSVFVGAPDRHYIALRTDTRVDGDGTLNPYLSSYWSYATLMLDASFDRELPLWFRNGLASVLSNSIVGKDQIKFGMPIPWHFQTLNEAPRLKLPELLATDATSPYYASASTRSHFDAQSWALVHFMVFGQAKGVPDGINTVVKLLREGRPSAEAVERVFGRLDVLQAAYARYLEAPTFPYSFVKVETRIVANDFSARVLSEPAAAAVRAGLHVAMGRVVEAKALIAEAQAKGDAPATSYEVAARLAEQERRPDDAMAALLKAEAGGSINFFTHYRLASLSWPTAPTGPSAFGDVERHARRAVELNDVHVPSLTLLASAVSAQNCHDAALPIAVKAASLEPRNVSCRRD